MKDAKEMVMIPWDASRFIGFTAEQIELIRRGWNLALNEAYMVGVEKKLISE